jgi:hypothetical protein
MHIWVPSLSCTYKPISDFKELPDNVRSIVWIVQKPPYYDSYDNILDAGHWKGELVYKIKSDQYYIEMYNRATYTRKMNRMRRPGKRN